MEKDLFEDKPGTGVQVLNTRAGRFTPDQARVMSQKVTTYNPELVKLEKVDLLVDDQCKDSLSDLQEKEITCIAAYRAFNDEILEIPAMMSFLDNIISLRRSRNAQTAQNLVEILKRRPNYYHDPYDSEIEAQNPNKKKWWQIWKRGDQ